MATMEKTSGTGDTHFDVEPVGVVRLACEALVMKTPEEDDYTHSREEFDTAERKCKACVAALKKGKR